MPSIHEAIKNIVSHGIRLRRSVSFLKLSRRMRLMFSPSLMTMRFRWWNPIHGADINSIFFFCNVYFLRFSLLMIVYYPRDVSCRWKPFSALAGNALSRIFQGEIPRSGRVYSRIRESDSAESWKPDVRGTSGRERIITMYTCIRLGERERKSGHVSRNGLKTFTTGLWKHVSLPRSVPFRFVSRKEGLESRLAPDASWDGLASLWRNFFLRTRIPLFTFVNDVKKRRRRRDTWRNRVHLYFTGISARRVVWRRWRLFVASWMKNNNSS